MLICVVYNEKACRKCKTVEGSEVKLRNHMANHFYKSWPSMSTYPCCWCSDTDCGVDVMQDKSAQRIHVHCNAFKFPPMKLSTTKNISVKKFINEPSNLL